MHGRLSLCEQHRYLPVKRVTGKGVELVEGFLLKQARNCPKYILNWLKTYFGIILDVFPSSPNNYKHIYQKDASYGCHYHRIVHKCTKQLCSFANIYGIGYDEEGAPKKGQMVAETLCASEICFWSYLKTRQKNPL